MRSRSRSKGATNAEAFGERHDATIAVGEEIGFHVILHQAASADSTSTAGAGSSLGKPCYIGAILGGLALDRKGFLGAQGRLTDPILKLSLIHISEPTRPY